VLAEFDPWLTTLWKALLVVHPLPEGSVIDDSPRLETPDVAVTMNSVRVEQNDVDTMLRYSTGFERLGLFGQPSLARITANDRMTSQEWQQDVREISFDVAPDSWGAGDVAWILPENNPSSVNDMLSFTQTIPDTAIIVTATSSKNPSFVGQCTIRELFARVLDIDSMPRPFAFEQLALCATNSEEQEKLFEIGGPEGVDLYYDYCYRERRSWVEVFRDFTSLRPSLDRLISLIPRLQPRAFSIASPPFPSHSLVLCIAVVKYKTPYGRNISGVCSSYIQTLQVGQQVPLWTTKGSFPIQAIQSTTTPLLLIGPGTGIAPMRSIALTRHYLRARELSNKYPQDLLYFGCRKRSADFLFGEELENLSGLSLYTAFSREQKNASGGRLYVTHLLREHGAAIYDIIQSGGYIFVAGSAGSMPKDVHAALVDVISMHGEVDATEATTIVRKLERQRRYCVEAYG